MKHSIKIRRIHQTEVNQAADVIVHAFHDAALKQDAVRDFKNSFNKASNKTCFVAILDKKIVGTIACVPVEFHYQTYGIDWVAVDPGHQGKGIGKAMVGFMERHIQDRLLKGKAGSILMSDKAFLHLPPGTHFYQRLGYTEGSILWDNVPLMMKNLSPMEPK